MRGNRIGIIAGEAGGTEVELAVLCDFLDLRQRQGAETVRADALRQLLMGEFHRGQLAAVVNAAQQAADPTFVIPAGKPVQANDSGSVFSDLMMLGPCTLHQYVEPEPTPGEGYYDENGNWVPAGETDPTDPEGSEEVSPEQGTDFLNWLLNTAA